VGYTTINGNLTLISLAAVATFDGNGNFSGMATIALAIPGAPENFRATFTGTYKVNPDGVSMSFNLNDGEQYDVYPTLDGSTFAVIETSPGHFQSGVYTRSSGKAEHEHDD